MSAAGLPLNLAVAAETMAYPTIIPVGTPLPIFNLNEPLYPLPVRALTTVADKPNPPDLFRNPNALMPLLTNSTNYVVYFIAAHGRSMMPVKMKEYNGTPYSVIQTGGGDATGCSFYFGSFKLLKNLFSINLPYSFQYLLGLYNDRLPRVFRDLIYSTSDEKDDTLLPNRHLSFSNTKEDKPDMGVFVFDPEEKKADGTPLFERWNGMEGLFTQKGGTTLFDVIDNIMVVHNRTEISYRGGASPRPAIFVFGSCADLTSSLTFANKNRIVSLCARCHYFSKSAGYGLPYYKFNEVMGPQPNLTKPINVISVEYTNLWHNLPARKMLNYYKKKETNTAAYLGKVSSGKSKPSSQRVRWKTEKQKTLNRRNRTHKNQRLLPTNEEYPVLPNYESPPPSPRIGGAGTSTRVATD